MIAFAAGLGALMPLATDIYVIMLPSIARDFGGSLAATQRTMVTFALGFGFAQLFVGIAADRWGRRPVAIVGLLLFLAASLAVIRAPSLDALTLFRFLQGASAATCPILSRAIIRDELPPHRLAQAFASTNVLIGIAPLLAPFLAAAANAWGGWRAALTILLVYGGCLTFAVIVRLPETRPPSPLGASPGNAASPFAVAGEILGHPTFLIGSFASTMITSALFTWLTTSPFLLIGRMGFSTGALALVFSTGAAFYIATNLVTARLASHHTPSRLLTWGAALMLTGSLTTWLILMRFAGRPSDLGPAQLILVMMPFFVGLGLAHPNALQIAMRPFGHVAGQASAWLGLMQQIGAVSVSLLAVWLGAGQSAVAVMIGCCCLMLAAARTLDRGA